MLNQLIETGRSTPIDSQQRAINSQLSKKDRLELEGEVIGTLKKPSERLWGEDLDRFNVGMIHLIGGEQVVGVQSSRPLVDALSSMRVSFSRTTDGSSPVVIVEADNTRELRYNNEPADYFTVTKVDVFTPQQFQGRIRFLEVGADGNTVPRTAVSAFLNHTFEMYRTTQDLSETVRQYQAVFNHVTADLLGITDDEAARKIEGLNRNNKDVGIEIDRKGIYNLDRDYRPGDEIIAQLEGLAGETLGSPAKLRRIRFASDSLDAEDRMILSRGDLPPGVRISFDLDRRSQKEKDIDALTLLKATPANLLLLTRILADANEIPLHGGFTKLTISHFEFRPM